MNVQSIREIARKVGIKPGKLRKEALIKNIQIREGNFDCFATASNSACDQTQCTWREDCFTIVKKGRSN